MFLETLSSSADFHNFVLFWFSLYLSAYSFSCSFTLPMNVGIFHRQLPITEKSLLVQRWMNNNKVVTFYIMIPVYRNNQVKIYYKKEKNRGQKGLRVCWKSNVVSVGLITSSESYIYELWTCLQNFKIYFLWVGPRNLYISPLTYSVRLWNLETILKQNYNHRIFLAHHSANLFIRSSKWTFRKLISTDITDSNVRFFWQMQDDK